MPVLVVYGMPNGIDPYLSSDLINKLQLAASGALQLSANEVSVFFPLDLVQEGLGQELVCLVEGLFVKPERTAEVRQRLFDAIADELDRFAQQHIPQCTKIEVIPSNYDQRRDGFALREWAKK
jgi:hypothetical protein